MKSSNHYKIISKSNSIGFKMDCNNGERKLILQQKVRVEIINALAKISVCIVAKSGHAFLTMICAEASITGLPTDLRRSVQHMNAKSGHIQYLH